MSADEVRAATVRRQRRERRSRWTILGILAAAVLVLDQIIKEIIRATYAVGEGREVTGFLEISRHTNEGIAFGLFPGNQELVSTLTIVALCAIALALVGLVRRNLWAAIGAGLVVGGSIGNLLDRVIHGGVTDYIDFSRWPAFNIADIGITVGAVLIVMGLLETTEDTEDQPT